MAPSSLLRSSSGGGGGGPERSSDSDTMTNKNICLQCKALKIQSDGAISSCGNCEKLNFDCSPQVKSSTVATSLRLQPKDRITKSTPQKHIEVRRRGPRACVECRVQKSRCSGEVPQCSNCSRRHKTCLYPLSKWTSPPQPSTKGLGLDGSPWNTIQQNHTTATSPVSQIRSHNEPPTLKSATVLQFIDTFFRHLYPVPFYTIIHQNSIKSKWSEGSLDECLTLAICSITALKLDQEKYYPISTTIWIQKAENIIWNAIEQPSISKVQALIFIILYHVEGGKVERAFMLSSLAARMASALRLNTERADLPFVTQEVRRRLMWTIAGMDNYFSVGLPEFVLFPYENIHVQLPCREEVFNGDACTETESLQPTEPRRLDTLGPYAFLIRCASMRRNLMQLTGQLSLVEQMPSRLDEQIQDIDKTLRQIGNDMGMTQTYAQEGLTQLIKSPWLPQHLAACLSWNQCYCELYQLFLPGYPGAASENVVKALDDEFILKAVKECIKHAHAIIQIFAELQKFCPATKLVDSDTVICAHSTARLILFVENFMGEAHQCPVGRPIDGAMLCLRVVRYYFPFSSYSKAIISDLQRLISTHSVNNSSIRHRELSPNDDDDLSKGTTNDDSEHLESPASATSTSSSAVELHTSTDSLAPQSSSSTSSPPRRSKRFTLLGQAVKRKIEGDIDAIADPLTAEETPDMETI